jgi:predicted ATP-grasp superfamily ATP-dependent carboligase
MRILLSEYLTGGGLWTEPVASPTDHPLLPEGQAMVSAMAADLSRIPGVELFVTRDARLPDHAIPHGTPIVISSAADEQTQLAAWATRVDGVLLIAPEYGRRLQERAEWTERAGGRLLSPDAAFIELATHKTRAAEHLARHGVPVPSAVLLQAGDPVPDEFPFPAVFKPDDGVGCLETHFASARDEVAGIRELLPGTCRVEAFCAGQAASVIGMCGPRRRVLLPPCFQHISVNGHFQYLGGAYPLPRPLMYRACHLARRAFEALPVTSGCVGLDLVLGDDPEGAQDVVIEVNPRLTTSYLGLRQATSGNLAAAMLAIQHGGRSPLFFQPNAVEFEADGRTRAS